MGRPLPPGDTSPKRGQTASEFVNHSRQS